MSKKSKTKYDTVISVSISKLQDKKLTKHAEKVDGNKSKVIRNQIDKLD